VLSVPALSKAEGFSVAKKTVKICEICGFFPILTCKPAKKCGILVEKSVFGI